MDVFDLGLKAVTEKKLLIACAVVLNLCFTSSLFLLKVKV